MRARLLCIYVVGPGALASVFRRRNESDLLDWFRDLVAGVDVSGWPAGKAFEHIIVRSFEIAGADVAYPFSVEMEGELVEQIDGAVKTSRIHALIESKDYDSPINIAPVAKLRHQLARRPACAMGCIFAAEGFTQAALLLTRHTYPLNILLWEKVEIEKVLVDARIDQTAPVRALETKLDFAIRFAMPDYNILAGYQ